MAINTDSAETPWGDRKNRKQCIMLLPAKAEANKPAVINLQSVDTGTVTDRYLFFRDGGLLAYSTTLPGTSSTHGDLVGTAGASLALDNLASVQIPDAGDLIPLNDDEVSLGSDGKGFSSGFFSTSVVFNHSGQNLTLVADEPSGSARTVTFEDPGGNDIIAYLAASQALTGKTYDGLTIATATTNTMSLTRGTASIILAEGDTDLALGAGAQVIFTGSAVFGQATGTTVDISANLTVSGAAVIDQDLSAGGSPTWTSLVTCQGIVNTNTAIDTTAQIKIGADNVKLSMGDDDESDSYIQYTGSVMQFWDTTTGPWTLNELATGTTLNPTVDGNFTIDDGNFTWGNAANNETAVWTFATISEPVISIVADALTDDDAFGINADAITSGTFIHLDTASTGSFTGKFLECISDGSTVDFSISRYGATVIAGTASGTDALTLTAGDILLTSGLIDLTIGNIDLANGMIVADTVQDLQSYFKRSFDGASAPVFAIENTHATGTGYAMSIVQAASSGASGGLTISNKGTSAILHLSAGTARTGPAIDIPMADMLAQTALLIDGAAVGSSGEGIIHVDVTGTLVGNPIRIDSTGTNGSTGQLIYALSAGKQGAATDGICAYFADTGAETSSSSTVYITSTSNTALNVASGTSLFVDAVTCTAGQQSSAVAVSTDVTKASAPIPVGTSFVTVTSGGTTEYLELPTAVVGNIIWLGAEGTGYQLAAADSTNTGEYINDGRSSDGDDDAWSQVTAGDTIRCVCTSTGKWIVTKFGNTGTESAITAAAST